MSIVQTVPKATFNNFSFAPYIHTCCRDRSCSGAADMRLLRPERKLRLLSFWPIYGKNIEPTCTVATSSPGMLRIRPTDDC